MKFIGDSQGVNLFSRSHLVTNLVALFLILFIHSVSVIAEVNHENKELDSINNLAEIGKGSLLFKHGDIMQDAAQLHTNVEMKISGMINRVFLRQSFKNTTDNWQEGIYVFPLPEDAAVDHMRLHIGERVIEGQIKEKQQAKKIYEKAKQKGQRAAITEQERPNIFTTSVANIPPGETVIVEIEYQQLVKYDSGIFSLRFPMVVGPRYIPGNETIDCFSGTGWAKNTDQVPDASRITPPVLKPSSKRQNLINIQINLDAGLAVEHIESPYHKINIEHTKQQYNITLRDDVTLANHDFVLRWRPNPSDAPRAAYFKENINNDTYSMIMLLPPETEQAITINREMIYVIDTSGSMGGQSIKQAKAALELALTRLTPNDKFNVIQFNSYTSRLFTSSKPANPTNQKKALRYIRKLHADGGTEMATAINTALDLQQESNLLRQVIFITDGSIGNEQTLFELIEKKLGDSRLFTVGIGSAPNSFFMRRAASFGKGTYTYIGKLNEVQSQMDELFAKIEKPVLKNITVNWSTDKHIEMWPTKIQDLYQGEPLLITTKANSLPDKITISGNINKQSWSTELKLNGGKAHQGISVLWARNKIASLMQFKRDSEFESIKKDIIETALTHHLVSQYTSLVAVDVTPIRPESSDIDTKAIPTHLPKGWNYNKVFGQPFPQTATNAELFTLMGIMLLLFAFTLRVLPHFTIRA